MYILLNGAFGIGKTTTARALLATIEGARLYDPEPIGVLLQRASALLRPGRRIDDFQDIASWRWITAWRARRLHRGATTLIVPMAFSNLAYLDALERSLAASGAVRKLCLVAPPDVVRERLRRRAEAEGTPVDRWALARADACCEAHRSPAFGQAVDATVPTEEIVRSVRVLAGLS